MRTPLLGRLEKLEKKRALEPFIVYRIGLLKPLPKDYVGSGTSLCRNEETFGIRWSGASSRSGRGPHQPPKMMVSQQSISQKAICGYDSEERFFPRPRCVPGLPHRQFRP